MLVGKPRKRIRVSACSIVLLELFCACNIALVPRALAQSSSVQNRSTGSGATPAEQLKLQRRTRKLEELIEQENFFDAAELLKTFSDKIVSQNKRLLVAKALVAKGLYQIDEAYELLKAALKLDENDALAQFETALILMERKEWKDADVLLRLAGQSNDLRGQRRAMLPYYMGVIAYETGRLFDARSSFTRTTWNESLDPALQQSVGVFMSRISRERPWTVVSPLSLQYDTNPLGLSRTTALPEGYSRRQVLKLIGGLFTNLEGLGGEKTGSGPFGLGLRLFAVQNLDNKFAGLNVQFVESEANWSRFLGKEVGVFKTAVMANLIRLSGRSLSSSLLLKTSLGENELSLAYERDLQKAGGKDTSAYQVRFAREQVLFNRGSVSSSLPFDFGARQSVSSSQGERKFDATLSPGIGWSLSRRLSLKLTEKLAAERLISGSQNSSTITRVSSGLNTSWTIQPFLIFSLGGSFDWEKNIQSAAVTQKAVATTTLLGIL
jgi:hypothetical protein